MILYLSPAATGAVRTVALPANHAYGAVVAAGILACRRAGLPSPAEKT